MTKSDNGAEAPKLAISINDFCARVGICRATFYELLNQDKVRTILIGRRRVIPVAEVERLMAEGTS